MSEKAKQLKPNDPVKKAEQQDKIASCKFNKDDIGKRNDETDSVEIKALNKEDRFLKIYKSLSIKA